MSIKTLLTDNNFDLKCNSLKFKKGKDVSDLNIYFPNVLIPGVDTAETVVVNFIYKKEYGVSPHNVQVLYNYSSGTLGNVNVKIQNFNGTVTYWEKSETLFGISSIIIKLDKLLDFPEGLEAPLRLVYETVGGWNHPTDSISGLSIHF